MRDSLVQLINWGYFDFEVTVKLTSYLFQVKSVIEKRHGRITDIVMYRDHVDDENKLENEMLTFEDLAYTGTRMSGEVPVRYKT